MISVVVGAPSRRRHVVAGLRTRRRLAAQLPVECVAVVAAAAAARRQVVGRAAATAGPVGRLQLGRPSLQRVADRVRRFGARTRGAGARLAGVHAGR